MFLSVFAKTASVPKKRFPTNLDPVGSFLFVLDTETQAQMFSSESRDEKSTDTLYLQLVLHLDMLAKAPHCWDKYL